MATKVVSIVTGGTNNAPVTAEEINAIATDFISNGVVGSITANTGSGGTGSFAVNAQSTPNMTVRVSGGQLYQSATPLGGNSQRIRVSMNTFEDVTIPSNSTGGTRYDWIYLALDSTSLATPAVTKDTTATLVVSRSTSNTVDNGTPPTYGYNLAVVTVANAAASITNANITEKRAQAGASAHSISSVTTPLLKPSTFNFTDGGATSFTTTSASYVDVTGITTTYTTGSTTERLFIWFQAMVNNSALSSAAITLSLGGADQADIAWYPTGAGEWSFFSKLYIYDAPANTAVTMKARASTSGGTLTFQRVAPYLSSIRGFAISNA